MSWESKQGIQNPFFSGPREELIYLERKERLSKLLGRPSHRQFEVFERTILGVAETHLTLPSELLALSERILRKKGLFDPARGRENDSFEERLESLAVDLGRALKYARVLGRKGPLSLKDDELSSPALH